MISEDKISTVSKLLSALGNPARLRIMVKVSATDRPLHIKAISKEMKLDYASTYNHVQVLKEAGLIHIYDVGRSRVIAVSKPEALRELLEKASAFIALKA